MIDVENLVFEYPGLRALDHVSLHIAQGSITALVGPNGAGKTTLLRCLAGLEQPVGGSIRVDGVDVLEQPRDCHRVIGYLSDFFGLYERLTVRQCLLYVARAQGMDADGAAQAVVDVSARLGLAGRLAARPGELSRGLRQRVAIAQAIIHAPRVVLLDEPASGLDPEARHELAQLFLDLQAQGMTLLVSSHILAELEAYSTDMLVLRHGRIIEQVRVRTHRVAQPFRLLLAEAVAGLDDTLRQIDGVEVLGVEAGRSALLRLGDDATRSIVCCGPCLSAACRCANSPKPRPICKTLTSNQSGNPDERKPRI
ncbi:MAG: ABC transporter ATP-binding protein [Candidatus Methylumidiphilus sp.]